MKIFVALISGALLSSAALAQHSSGASTGGSETTETREAPASATEAPSTPVGERRVCRRIESTGSRLGIQRVCMTQREWRQYNRNN